MVNKMQAVLTFLTTVNAGCVSVVVNQVASPQPYGEGDVLFDKMAKNTNTSSILPEMLIDQFKSYVAVLQVGSDRQLVTPIVDFGASDTWLMSVDSPLCKGDESDCTGKAFDDKSSSTSLNLGDAWTISYRDGNYASGSHVKDDIVLSDGTEIKGAEFLLADTATSNGTILGLGIGDTLRPSELSLNETHHGKMKARRASDSDKKTSSNFPFYMKDQGLINRVVYSMFFNDTESNTGEILFGGVDHSKYEGDLGLLPIHSSEKRSIAQPGLRVMINGMGIRKNGQSCGILDFAMPFMLDSSTSYAIMPSEIVEQMAKVIGFERRGVFYGGNCDGPFSFDTFELDFMGLKLQVPPKSLMVQEMDQYGYWREVDGKKQCYLAILATEDIRLAILGDIFMSNFYVVYDLESNHLAMAQAKFDAKSSQVEEIKSTIPSASPVRFYAATMRQDITPLEHGTCFVTNTKDSLATPVVSESGIKHSPSLVGPTTAILGSGYSRATSEVAPVILKYSNRMTAQTQSLKTSLPLAMSTSLATVDPLYVFKIDNKPITKSDLQGLNDTVKIIPPARFTAKPSIYGSGQFISSSTVPAIHYGSNQTEASKHPNYTSTVTQAFGNVTQPLSRTVTVSDGEFFVSNGSSPYTMSTIVVEPVIVFNESLPTNSSNYTMTTQVVNPIVFKESVVSKGPNSTHLDNSSVEGSLFTIQSDPIVYHYSSMISPLVYQSLGAAIYSTAKHLRPSASVLENESKVKNTGSFHKGSIAHITSTPVVLNVTSLTPTDIPYVYNMSLSKEKPSLEPTPTALNVTSAITNYTSSAIGPTPVIINLISATVNSTPYIYNVSIASSTSKASSGPYTRNMTMRSMRSSATHSEPALMTLTSVPYVYDDVAQNETISEPIFMTLTSVPYVYEGAAQNTTISKPALMTLASAPYVYDGVSQDKTVSEPEYMTLTSVPYVYDGVTRNTTIPEPALMTLASAPYVYDGVTRNTTIPEPALMTLASAPYVYDGVRQNKTVSEQEFMTLTSAPYVYDGVTQKASATSTLPDESNDMMATITVPPGNVVVETAVLEVPIDEGETTVHILTTIDITHYVNYTVRLPRPTPVSGATATPTTALRTITKVPLSDLLPAPTATAPPSACDIPDDACIVYTVSHSTHFTTTLTVCDPEKVMNPSCTLAYA